MNTRKKREEDDFEKHLGKQLADPEFAEIYREEREKLNIALKIAEIRVKRGLSQEELARKLHTSQSVVSRLESSGYENYSIKTLRKVASALHAELVVELKLAS